MSALDRLARYLINEWGDYVKVDDIPEEYVILTTVKTMQQAAAELAALKERLAAFESKVSYVISQLDIGDNNRPVEALARGAKERIEKLESDLRSAPNPYAEDFELSKYKSWYVTDRMHNLRAERVK